MHKLSIRLGKFPFFNCVPIFYALERGKISPPINIQAASGTPTEINSLFKEGRLDLGVISSLAYAEMAEECLILPQLSISSYGKVESVILFSRVPIRALDNQPVMLSPHSATSVLLLKLIFSKYFRIQPKYLTGEIGQANGSAIAGLVIGDMALKLKAANLYPYQLDLGKVWYDLTRLPFVFGLFTVRKCFWERHKKAVKEIWQALQASKKWGLTHLELLANSYSQPSLAEYWRHLNYDLTPTHLKGLRLFFHLLREVKEIEKIPSLKTLILSPTCDRGYEGIDYGR